MAASSPSSARVRTWSFLAAGLALAAGIGVVVQRGQGPPPSSVLDAAPEGSWLVATLDVAAARPLLRPLLEASGGLAGATRVAGLGDVATACGFEPLEHVRYAMVANPESGGERGDFGLAVAPDGSLSADDLAACARKAIAARGGKPASAAHGTFTVVSDDAVPKQAQLAVRKGGPFLVGRGAWLGAMMAAVEGSGGRASPDHAALRASLSAPADSPVTPALLVTMLLPKPLRDRLRDEAPSGALLGVLAVDWAGLAVAAAGGAGGSTSLALELHCEPPDAAARCAEVKKLIERGRLSLAQDFAVRFTGLGSLVDTFKVVEDGAGALAARAHAPTDDLARALSRLFDATAAREDQRPAPPPPNP